ncbi:MBL fold metallo-hydrolase [Aquisalibacillus elongatus]|uniref:Glyoxylase-like metal-dependent hydrolase (Beta-lactamase superfamily II) n=1 Tax=Aquisalibacillus elongatus TaxID=485577 RepID=A0A3N5CEP1_9BACI|nr:MBL fold metallo-hydrolase [Aquisalibacillus elongatus]RPF55701.1 glyoxylase-like metal-dependent hydrolase (beta-lactamase superfamily II) [Aquisalibacillus elongatus]
MTEQTIHQITLPTPYAVGDVHLYVVIDEAVTLIDAGVHTDEAWEVFKGELKKLNLTIHDIDQVVLTHHHPDHIGLVGRLDHVDRIYGDELVHTWLTRDQAYFDHYLDFFNQMYEKWGVPEPFRIIHKSLSQTLKFSTEGALTDVLTEGDAIPGLSDFITLETPGHAESHLSFYNSKTGDFLGGDFLIKHISSNPLLEPPRTKGKERPKPLLHYRDSMKKVLDYNFSSIYPGHGEIFSGHHSLILDRLAKQEKRAYKVLDFLKEKPATPFEVCQFLFPKHYERQFGLTMSETVGQLDYLMDVGEIVEQQDSGTSYFAPKYVITKE